MHCGDPGWERSPKGRQYVFMYGWFILLHSSNYTPIINFKILKNNNNIGRRIEVSAKKSIVSWKISNINFKKGGSSHLC